MSASTDAAQPPSQDVAAKEHGGSPDADRPLRLSRAEAAAAKDSWVGLLSSLSDEELTRYADIARDQRQLEWNNAALQAFAIAVSLVLLAVVIAEVYAGWSWQFVALTAVVTGMCANFPWQKHRMRRLWGRHIRAVEAELARRKSPDASTGGANMGSG